MAAPSWSRSTRLQQFTRRILEKLRPVGLAELGLREALAPCSGCGTNPIPMSTIETTISQSLGDTGETADLTIYRIVQEALTNVFRHAEATEVNVSIEPAERPAGARMPATARWCGSATMAAD